MKEGAIALIIIIVIILIFMIVGLIWDKKAKVYDHNLNYHMDEEDDKEEESNDNKAYYD